MNPGSPVGNYDALMSGIDKLFSERVEYFGRVDWTRGGILMGIVKVLVKVCIILQ
jgi:hypothetical protein